MSSGKPGRPRKAEKYGGHIAAAEDRIADRLPSLIDNLLTLADGVKVKDVAPDGSVDYYAEPPDLKANIYLIDRILGKPTERTEHSGEDGGALKVVIEYAGPDPPDLAPAPPGAGDDPL